MYAVMYYNEEAVFVSAKSRSELNKKVREYEDIVFNRFGDLADNFMEERVYSDGINSFEELKASEPKFTGYVQVGVDDFYRLGDKHQLEIDKITEEHDKFFSDINNKIETKTPLGAFLHCVLGDYIWDINEDVVQGNAFQVFWYWGSVEEYVKFLNDEMKNARNSIINLYLLYLANKEDLEDCQPDDMNDISMEYLNKIGSGIVCDEIGENSLDNLTVKEIKELNKYLEATGFDKIVF